MFPFDLPRPTIFYEGLYLLTLIVHAVFVSYVLAGLLYLLWVSLVPGPAGRQAREGPLATLLRDWLPFVLSAAITAGVAPLLFVQILYQREFYTANLLLWWRWLLIVPALIVAFYLLYLVKSRPVAETSGPWRLAVVGITVACVLFIAFSWTLNHLLSLSPRLWETTYLTQSFGRLMPNVLPRLAIWVGGTFGIMASVAGWQLYWMQQTGRADRRSLAVDVNRLGLAVVLGLCVSAMAAVGVYSASYSPIRFALLGTSAVPYVALVVVAGGCQLGIWLWQAITGQLRRVLLIAGSVACLLMLLGMAALRELIRVESSNMWELEREHLEASRIGGFHVFVLFALVNFGLIVYCILLVRRCLSSTSSSSTDSAIPDRQSQSFSEGTPRQSS